MSTNRTKRYGYGVSVVAAALLLLTGLSACVDNTPMQMSPAQKTMVDTLYNRITPKLRPELDSLCDAAFDTRVQLAVDSILALRLREKQQLLRRAVQNKQ
ncbi:MAG: hypothetical protein AAFO94_04295 [Bacteroidota bacterium]